MPLIHILTFTVAILLVSVVNSHAETYGDADLRWEYHTNFHATQAKIRTHEEGFTLWMPRHNELKNRVRKGPVDLLMIGDSITFRWERHGKEMWEKYYGKRRAVQIGSSGDMTDHILWRIQNGGVAGCNPKLVVVLAGTNNTGLRKDPPEETAYGIFAIVQELRKRLPESKILLLGIFPRGNAGVNENQRSRAAAFNEANNKVNSIVKTYADDKTIFYHDLGHVWVDEEGQIDKTLMPDYVHPGKAGYDAWGKAMEPIIRKHLGE